MPRSYVKTIKPLKKKKDTQIIAIKYELQVVQTSLGWGTLKRKQVTAFIFVSLPILVAAGWHASGDG